MGAYHREKRTKVISSQSAESQMKNGCEMTFYFYGTEIRLWGPARYSNKARDFKVLWASKLGGGRTGQQHRSILPIMRMRRHCFRRLAGPISHILPPYVCIF